MVDTFGALCTTSNVLCVHRGDGGGFILKCSSSATVNDYVNRSRRNVAFMLRSLRATPHFLAVSVSSRLCVLAFSRLLCSSPLVYVCTFFFLYAAALTLLTLYLGLINVRARFSYNIGLG